MQKNSFKRCPRLLYKNIKLKTPTSIVDEIALFIHYVCTVYLCGGPQSKNRFHLVGSNFFCMPSRILDFSRVGSWDERRRGREKLCSMSRERCCSGRWWYDNNVMRRVALLGSYFFYQLLLSCCCCPDDCVKYFSIHCDFLQKSYSRDDKYCLALHTAFDTVENVTRIGRQTQINLKWGTVSGHSEWS